MILYVGERVYWGAVEVIYLEGVIQKVDEENQAVLVHIDRATPHSAHLIDSEIHFAANGLMPLRGSSPPGTTTERNAERPQPRRISPEEKIRMAAAVAIHQQFGYNLPQEQEQSLITQVAQTLDRDQAVREHIISTMDEILRREF
jgi:hypothetical protein